jgi:flagellar M-ring protein FliF
MRRLKVFENFRKYWEGLPGKTRFGLISGVAGILVLTVLAGYWLLKTDYQVLFSDLQPQDAANITGELERMKVPYKLSEEEGKILVDKSSVHETRLKLMGKGVSLNGNVGFEIFDKSDYGMTEYAQKINYQRALQGELARTIASIKEVKFARVHLVLPESSIFKQNKSQPKASVSLVLKNETRLAPDQIRGIQGLVAAAVPGLESNEVSVLDQRGVMLSSNSEKEGGIPALSGQLAIKKEVESYLARKAMEVLDRAFGPGQAVISVDVTLNLDNVKSTEENILPVTTSSDGAFGAIARKRTTIVQRPSSDSKTIDQTVAYQNDMGRYQNSTSEVEYTLGKKIEQVITTPGSIRRLSVGVLVPHDMEDDRLAKVKDIVAMAVGMNQKRGDAIAVHSAPQFKELRDITGAQSSLPEAGDRRSAQHESTKQAERVFTDSIKDMGNYMLTYPLRAGAVLLALVLIVGIGVSYLGSFRKSSRGPQHVELTQQQREDLLQQIKQWISLESKPAEGSEKS